jgi:hypothetical protein
MRLRGQLVHVTDLKRAQRDAMFALMDRYYENVERGRFEEDLAEKQWVIQLIDPISGELVGFSTQVVLEAEVGGQTIKALFSGDTIIVRDRWGDNVLTQVWGRFALMLIDGLPGSKLYWFLISKGYKTYRFLPLFFREFYPRFETPMPAGVRAVVNALAQQKFPGSYDAVAGVVRGGPDKDRLRSGVADLSAERLRDPHVRFFAEHNPGHIQGDELCCLAPLTRANFTPAAYRVIGPEPVEAEVGP